MLQRTLKAGLIAVVVGLAVQNASAFGHRGWGWGGGYGCGWGGGYAGCGYGGYGGGYGCGGSYAGYSGCGYPGYAYGGYGGCGPGGCSTGPGTAPAAAPKPGMTPYAPAPNTTSNYNDMRPDCLMIAVNVPADAKVTINDRATTSTGAQRTYVSSNVLPNTNYHYNVRVDFVRDGKPVTDERAVDLSAGKTASLDFSKPAEKLADIASSAQR